MRNTFVALAVGTATTTVVLADVAQKFEDFKMKFKKNYKSAAEELQRFKIFAANMETAEKMSLLDPNAKYGHLSPMADLSEWEFGKYNTLKVTKSDLLAHEQKVISVPVTSAALPTEFDWRKKGAVGPVKNQAQCGSCWAFATIANVEGSNKLVNGELLSLSEQELVDCDDNDNGCNGGLPSNAYKDMIDNDLGLELESAYGYEAHDSKCRAKKGLEKVYLKSWVAIGSNEDQMAAALMKYGPLAIGINAGPMQLYMGGISDPWMCNPAALDHGVALVAFGEEDGKLFWTIRNSWGADWGEEGYYRIVRGKGKCGLNRMVTSAIVKKASNTATELLE
ncbi:unnamed protein product [Amoebophrya sp. A120]|nr:unnamed protein product [Amoebophrya sp. A120]|eukprot:GSA120T00023365001.1